MTIPPVRPFHWRNTHRLIPSRYSEAGTVLSDLAANAQDLEDLIVLDGATNDRLQSELHGTVGISIFELVYAIPNAHIVNAAFTHPNVSGSRFNDGTRGAWYAARNQKTSVAEVTYHKARRLAEMIVPDEPDQRPSGDTTTYDDWAADFQADFHILDPAENFVDLLLAEPVPECYAASQALARHLLEQGANGIVYPSVRHKGSRCIACFRPALVYNPRRAARLEISLTANRHGYTHGVLPVPL